jgi:GTP:adenosylcobinamide-phosphate guanylyltransferase
MASLGLPVSRCSINMCPLYGYLYRNIVFIGLTYTTQWPSHKLIQSMQRQSQAFNLNHYHRGHSEEYGT